MPIKGLTDQPRQFTEIGQLRKGAPKPKNAKRPGADLTYFRATFEPGEEEAAALFTQVYGDEPREINIRLPFNTVDENFDAWREAYVQGGLVHRCDGEEVKYEVDPRTGSITVMNGLDADGKLVKCDGEADCKPTGRLKVIVPELRRLAFVTVLTTSIWDILNISQQLEAIRYVNDGKLQRVPLVLKRRPRKISTPSGTGNKRARRESWLLSIEADPAWVETQIIELPPGIPAPGLPLGWDIRDLEDEVLDLPPGVPEPDDGNGEVVESEAREVEDEAIDEWPDRPWDAATLKRALVKKVKEYRGRRAKPSEKQLDYARSSLSGLELSDPERHTVTLYLFDVESAGGLSAARCSALIDWIGAKPPDYEVSEDAVEEARGVVRQYEVDRGQIEMELPPD